jgi:hypothetical protein
MMRWCVFILGVLLAVGCTRNSGGMQLEIAGQVQTVPQQTALEGADFALFERAVEDGALQAEALVAEATSDELGRFSALFPRKSSYSLRWTATALDHFPEAGAVDPDALYPNAPYPLEIGMHAICTLHVQLMSLAPEDSTDNLKFNLGDDFPCDCCPTDQILLEGIGADSSWDCLMYGDHWMTWGADLEVALIGQPEGLFVDSVYCPAFGAADLILTW